jgi:hypothetical protein
MTNTAKTFCALGSGFLCALGVGFLLVGAVGQSVLLASIGVAFLALSLALVVSFDL